MLTKTTMALVSVLVLGATSGALALEGYDGDNNPIPGYARQSPSSIERSFAAPRPTVKRRGIERSFAAPRPMVRRQAIERSFAAPPPVVTGRVRSYGANGPAWQRNFDNYLSSID